LEGTPFRDTLRFVTELVILQNIRIPRMYAPLDCHPFIIQLEQETLGVPVVTYGETQDFPAFYSPTSGFKVRFRVARGNYVMHSIFLGDPEPMASK